MAKRLSLFFGAGAEIAYGMPAGGRFALDIFRRNPDDARQLFSAMRTSVDVHSSYASHWLPEKYQDKRINVFGKSEKTAIFESSLEYRRRDIRRHLENYDHDAREIIRRSGIREDAFSTKFEQLIGVPIGERSYIQAIELNRSLNGGAQLFGSHYFSAALDILKINPGNTRLKKLILATLQLYIGSLSQELISSLNEELFSRAPEDMSVFDDLSGIFRLEYTQAGLSAYETIMDERIDNLKDDDSCETSFEKLIFGVLESILASCLDYQALVDGHYRYLYNPKEWAKFCKISIFLHTVRAYIEELERNALAAAPGRAGYYHDLIPFLRDGRITLDGVGTVNYTAILQSVMDANGFGINARFLNGSMRDYYDPYRNQILQLELTPEEIERQKRFLVPFLFTQSGIKPLTSVEMSRRYVEFYDEMKDSDAVVVIGFGFNGDDSHVNGMFRDLIDDGRVPVYICDYAENGLAAYDMNARRSDLARRIRVERRNDLQIIPVDNGRNTSGGQHWLENVLEKLEARMAPVA